MPTVLLFNKPFQVMSQFSACDDKMTLSDYIDIPSVRPAGRLDYDSEGLLLLTADGRLQHRITDPTHKLPKTYLVQVEGCITDDALKRLQSGVILNDGPTRDAEAVAVGTPDWLWDRQPPIRYRTAIPTSWLELTIHEGRNRQVRRMTAAVGFPTLRLVRLQIGPWTVRGLNPGEYRWAEVPASVAPPAGRAPSAPPTEPHRHATRASRKGRGFSGNP